ncbi:hypothetical protein PVAND_017094 [Polypedilum vanderplanki]|uniref:V-type proton ATPase subunit S1/VOA1 transmembrane domain-containing protein n=1 Tax=Polypedilum vanderplanki TaxID=319348 RepID=A0A9J6BH43_POLVA|nr:hypothetical protein PVAND_017094 [Polypedilum vanderplanki]
MHHQGVQIQPFLHSNDLIFGTAHDCIGFTSPGILAGLFVTGILLSILAIGITAIMNIHVPDRFDNRKSKQFYQNVQ